MAATLGFRVRLAHDARPASARTADAGRPDGLAALSPAAIHDGAAPHLGGAFAEAVPAGRLPGAAP